MGGLNEIGGQYGDDDNRQFDGFTDGTFEQDGPNEGDGDYNPRKLRGGMDTHAVGFDLERYPKRQKKRRSSLTNYELAPRSRIPSPVLLQTPVVSSRQISPSEWTEHEKFMLLEIWGDKFLNLGRKSLRSEDWVDVAEKVTEAVKVERTVEQCRGMMDVLKRKYKKEKAKGGNSKWAYYRKLDMLFGEVVGSNDFVGIGGTSSFSLGCGIDAGEFIFMDTRTYLERANGNDEMRDSPCGSEGEEDAGENELGAVGDGGTEEEVKGLRVLADSVMKFGEIYEKIEHSKREQMVELERLRVDFQKELEAQKKIILEKAQEEIAKIRGEDDGDYDEDYKDMDDVDNDYQDGEGEHDGVYNDPDDPRENAHD